MAGSGGSSGDGDGGEPMKSEKERRTKSFASMVGV